MCSSDLHEYFHSLQRIPIMNRGIQVWPHAWWREGSATWVGNIAAYSDSYENYKNFFSVICNQPCMGLTEADIAEFFTNQIENNIPSKFDQFLTYSLGMQAVDVLVAMKGPDVLIKMYALMGEGRSFDDSFKSLFGISWSQAIPILSKNLYLRFHPIAGSTSTNVSSVVQASTGKIITPTDLGIASRDLKECRIPDARIKKVQTIGSIAYPAVPWNSEFTSHSTITIAILPFDFADNPGTQSPKLATDAIIRDMESWSSWFKIGRAHV